MIAAFACSRPAFTANSESVWLAACVTPARSLRAMTRNATAMIVITDSMINVMASATPHCALSGLATLPHGVSCFMIPRELEFFAERHGRGPLSFRENFFATPTVAPGIADRRLAPARPVQYPRRRARACSRRRTHSPVGDQRRRWIWRDRSGRLGHKTLRARYRSTPANARRHQARGEIAD